jgi:hypothetical protein
MRRWLRPAKTRTPGCVRDEDWYLLSARQPDFRASTVTGFAG